jgi:uncharacterized protein YneF (UPF0154 family)
MKKVIIGLVAAGATVGLFVAARRMSEEMRKHSEQMAAHCKQMAAHCKEMMASRSSSTEAPSEHEVNEIKKQRAAAPTA